MKAFIVTTLIVGTAAIAGTVIYMNCHRGPTAPVPVVESSLKPVGQMEPDASPFPEPETAPVVVPKTNEPAASAVAPAAHPVEVRPELAGVPHSEAVETLVSAQTSYADRQALVTKLKKLHELDAAIVELRQRAMENPNDVGIQTALGEALMTKFPIPNYQEAAMLGLQIDQSFNAALKLDPANWEAQYSKALALAGWPAEMNTGPEVIQRLSKLIDQQEALPSQPQFVRSYVLLGDQYQKAGKSAEAQAAWQLGLAKFPGDAGLKRRVAGN